MVVHHTKNKGDLGVLKAMCDLCQKGYIILKPETEHAPFDIAIWKDGVFSTVQVKYRSVHNGNISAQFVSTWSDRHGTHRVPVNKNYIDIYCIFCPDTDECYYIKSSDFNKSVTLRVEMPKNNQKKNINLASDYREVP